MSLELSPHVHKEGKNVFKPVTFFFFALREIVSLRANIV